MKPKLLKPRKVIATPNKVIAAFKYKRELLAPVLQEKYAFNFIINMGKPINKPFNYEGIVLNDIAGRSASGCKVTTSHLLRGKVKVANKVKPLPRILTDQFYDEIEAEFSFPVVFKLKRGHGGKGFKIARTKLDCKIMGDRISATNAQLSYFVEPYFPFTREFRVHASPHLKEHLFASDTGNKLNRKGCILMQEKVKLQETNSDTSNFVAGEIKFTQFFRLPEELRQQMINECVEATKLVGLDFAAVDVLYNEANNTFVICDVNSNPGMHSTTEVNITAEYYKKALPIILNTKYKTECANFSVPSPSRS